jgi:hypothetical protein
MSAMSAHGALGRLLAWAAQIPGIGNLAPLLAAAASPPAEPVSPWVHPGLRGALDEALVQRLNELADADGRGLEAYLDFYGACAHAMIDSPKHRSAYSISLPSYADLVAVLGRLAPNADIPAFNGQLGQLCGHAKSFSVDPSSPKNILDAYEVMKQCRPQVQFAGTFVPSLVDVVRLSRAAQRLGLDQWSAFQAAVLPKLAKAAVSSNCIPSDLTSAFEEGLKTLEQEAAPLSDTRPPEFLYDAPNVLAQWLVKAACELPNPTLEQMRTTLQRIGGFKVLNSGSRNGVHVPSVELREFGNRTIPLDRAPTAPKKPAVGDGVRRAAAWLFPGSAPEPLSNQSADDALVRLVFKQLFRSPNAEPLIRPSGQHGRLPSVYVWFGGDSVWQVSGQPVPGIVAEPVPGPQVIEARLRQSTPGG